MENPIQSSETVWPLWQRLLFRFFMIYLILQMPYPSLVQFYTPLGEFTPMRFTWMFMGYSFPYQFFGGRTG